MFKCEKMAFCNMFLQPEAAFETISRLGNMNCIQFNDLNEYLPPYLKNYIAEVCRCAEVERKLRYVESEILKDQIQIQDPAREPPPVQPSEMGALENLVEKWEKDILDISENQVNLRQDVLEMKEMRYVLNHIGLMLGNVNLGMERILARGKTTGAGDIILGGQLNVLTGVVKRTRSYPFQMMLWRISRGNIYYREAVYDEVLQDPYTGAEIRKVAFLIVSQGEMLFSRLKKVLSGFRVNTYPVPQTAEERLELYSRVQNRIDDLEHVMKKANYYRCRTLRVLSRKLRECMIQVRKAKAVYHNMNLFTLDITKNCLIGQCWLAERHLKKVQDTLESCSEMQESSMKSFISKINTKREPPTTQKTDKFTYGFQMLINAYGDAKYGEVNPGLFTLIAFPFLFAVMFGDSGHAAIIIAFAAWMIIMEKEYMAQRGSEIWNIFFGGRYVMLLLGLFSLYTGFIYNEVFSKSFTICPSMWKNTVIVRDDLKVSNLIQLSGKSRLNKPYPYGMDPIWQIAKNKIMNSNSLKMKMSIIIGVIHMLFGIIISILNHVHFKHYYAIFLQFIPEFTFLFCIFFWLVVLIYFKWIFYWDSHHNVQYGSSCAPQILILFIDMVLYGSTTKKEPEAGCKIYLFESQATLQFYLLTIALSVIPILLFGSPLYLYWQKKKRLGKITGSKVEFRSYQGKNEKSEEHLEEDDEPFSELMIHQAVHTIEFVLSTISHTASYLRLWALSLAHSQLSEMLWEMVLSKMGLHNSGPSAVPKIFIAFIMWAGFTVAILVVMEGLSSFLHTLRLHWVEFMSKFYIGGGTPFRPFSFQTILDAEGDNSDAVCTAKSRPRDHIVMKNVELRV